MPHVGVMKEEISSLLKDVPEGYFIDATYGDGSHFEFIDLEKKFTSIGFDRDFDSVAGKKNNHNVVQLNFSKIYDFTLSHSLIWTGRHSHNAQAAIFSHFSNKGFRFGSTDFY